MKKILITSGMILLLVTGCGKTIPKLSNGDEAVVSFGDNLVSVNELYEEMKDDYALSVLLDLVDTKLLNEIYPTDSDEDLYVENTLDAEELNYNYYYTSYYSTFELYLQAKYGNMSLDFVKERIRLDYKRELALNDYALELVTDKEIKAYYKDKTIGDIRASHILIKVEYDDDATDDEKEKADTDALEKAKELISKLNNGEDFAELAKDNSQDEGSASNGGDVSWFNRGDMNEEFEEAAIALTKGEYSKEPVKSTYGYHIILKTDEKDKPELDSVKENIREILSEEKIEEDTEGVLSIKALFELRDKHNVNIEDSELAKQYKLYKSQY